VLFVNCGDVFAWGCADAEDVTTGELPDLFRLFEASPKFGHWQWVCRKRNRQPQYAARKLMRADGAWPAWMAGLPENDYDRPVAARPGKINANI
jgi:hypothetical protein